MTQFTYAFDPHAALAANKIVDETSTLALATSGYRIILPTYAPFYDTKAFSIKVNNISLALGIDYYLSHKYHTAVEKTGKLLYGGIWIVNPNLKGTVKVSYHTLGGNYTASAAQIADYKTRVTDIENASWEEVLNDDPYFPDVDVQFDRTAKITESDVTTELNALATSIVNKDRTESDIYQMLDEWFLELEDVVDSSPISSHKNNLLNPHQNNWYEAAALGVNGIAIDASTAYNKSLTELTTYINALGLTQSDLDNYVKLSGGNTIVGDVQLTDGAMSIRFMTSNLPVVRINMSSGNIHLDVVGGGIIQADKNSNKAGMMAELKAGPITLQVVSTGGVTDNNALLLNGKPVIHAGNIDSNVPEDSVNVIDIVTTDSTTLKILGKGVSGDPLKANVVLPTASTSIAGIAKGTSATNSSSTSLVAYSEGAKLVYDEVATKVNSALTINNDSIIDGVTITKDMLGLGNVDNVSDANMPATADNLILLSGKALATHTHEFSEMGVPNATTSVYGVAKTIGGTTSQTEALAYSEVSALNQKIVGLSNIVETSVPDDVMDLTQYGGNSYLPIPILGSYEGSAMQSQQQGLGVLVERNGDLVVLRNGEDVNTKGVFYVSAKLSASGIISSLVSTATRYSPNYLAEGYKVLSVGRNSDDVMLALVENAAGVTSTHLIFLYKTFDDTQHVGFEIDSGLSTSSDAFHIHRPFIYGEYVYIYSTKCASTSNTTATPIACVLTRAKLTSFVTGAKVTFTELAMSGKNLYGESVAATTQYPLVSSFTKWSSKLIADKPLFLQQADDYTQINGYHSGRSQTDLVIEDNKMRIAFGMSTVGWYGTGVHTGHFSASFVIDLDTLVLTPDANCAAPINFTTGHLQTGDLTRSPAGVVSPYSSSSYSAIYHSGGFNFASSTAPNVGMTLSVWKDVNNNEFDSANVNNRAFTLTTATGIKGTYGSVLEDNQYSVGVGANKDFTFIQRGTSQYIRAVYSKSTNYGTTYKDLGPTTDRTVIQSSEFVIGRQLVVVSTDDGTAFEGGGIVGTDRLSCVTNSAGTSTISITQTVLDSITNAAIASLGVTVAGPSPVTYLMVLTGVSNTAFVTVWYMVDTSPASTIYLAMKAVFDIKVTVSAGKVTGYSGLSLITNTQTRTNGTAYNTSTTLTCNSSGVIKRDSELIVLFNTAPDTNYVGWIGYFTTSLKYNISTGKSTVILNYEYDTRGGAEGPLIVPGVGLVAISNDASLSAVFGTIKEPCTGYSANEKILLSSAQVVSGWNIYFTEEVQYFCQSTSFTMPIYSVDLAASFPATYKSNTFYIYASIDGGTPHYVVTEQYIADTTTDTYVGFCKTSAVGIVTLEAFRATRLGSFRELEEHLTDPAPHGYDPSSSLITADTLGMGLVVNKPTRNELVNATFSDVFNTWYRMSHSASYPKIYPALVDETATWVYNEDEDYVSNTTNSSSYIGFVSPADVTVGDYDFITLVSSTAGDDDTISVIPAFVSKDGIEHTISVLVMGTATRTEFCRIEYNSNQASSAVGNIKLLSQTTSLFSLHWNRLPERRIAVSRRGSAFSVNVKTLYPTVMLSAGFMTLDELTYRDNVYWIVRKTVYFKAGTVTYSAQADDNSQLYIDRTAVYTNGVFGTKNTGTFTVTEGNHEIAFIVKEVAGSTGVSCSFTDGTNTYSADTTWEGAIFTGDYSIANATHLPALDLPEINYTFDVNDYTLLSMFKGAVRFGYGAQSQGNSRWINILRPDEDGSNYYATQKLLNDNTSWLKKSVTVKGVVSDTDVVSGAWVFDIPIPAGYESHKYLAYAAWDQGVATSNSSGGLKSAAIKQTRLNTTTIRFTATTDIVYSTLQYQIIFFDEVVL